MKLFQLIFLALLSLTVAIRVILAYSFPPTLKPNQNISFSTTLLSEPTDYGNYKKVNVVYATSLSLQTLALILAPEEIYHYGDTIAISGAVLASKSPSKTLLLYHPHVQLVEGKQNPFLQFSSFLRQQVQNFYNDVLPPKSAALLLGIVLGIKGNFPQNFLSDLQATGVMHVIAASGMNVTMVSGFLLGLLALFLKRQWAVGLTIAGILFYCMLSGFQASILRATVMLVFALIAQLFGRQYASLYGATLAALGMLLYNPTWITDVGFQLSFAATLGIFFLKPLLPAWGIFADDMSTTIAAQIATLPILVGAFGSYGLLSILVNALVLWTIPLLMILGGIGALVGFIFLPLAHMLIWLCEPLLWFFESIVTYFGNLHWQISLPSIPIAMAAGYYLILVSLVLFIRQKISK